MHKLIYILKELYGVSCVIFGSNKLLISNTLGDSISIISLENECFKIDTVSVFDMISEGNKLEVVNRIEKIGIHQLYRDEKEGIIYSVNSYDNSVFKIDIENKRILDHVYVGKNPSHLSLCNDLIFVTNSDSNSISVIEQKSFELIENISVGEKPHDIILDSKNNKIYIANSNGYSMDVIDVDRNKIKRINLKYNPLHFKLYEDKLYIIAGMSNGMHNSYISIFDTNEEKSIKEVEIENMIYNIECGVNGSCIYTPNIGDGFLYKIDFGEIDYIKKYPIGGMPCNLKSVDQYIFISDVLNNKVVVFDHKNEKVVTRLKVGKEPNGIMFLTNEKG